MGKRLKAASSWKVAYADFVTAMMAFFLLMWLLSMSPTDVKQSLAEYFQRFSLFQKGGSALQENGSTSASQTVVQNDAVPDSLSRAEDSLLQTMENDITSKLSDLRENISLEKIDDGVRIQIMDKDGQPMFAVGRSELTPNAKRILKVITDKLKELDNKISVEGHTDNLGFAGDASRNWDLSSERASAARREMQADGLDPGRVDRVSGFSANQPLIKENPGDPRNRRISILVHSKPKQSKKELAPFTDQLQDIGGAREMKPITPPPQPEEILEQRVQRVYDKDQPGIK